MDKVAVYAGTENVFPQMYTALKSLLINTEMDRVYLLIDKEKFPFHVPDNVKIIDVSEQPFFPSGGANSTSRWTYMDMLRCCLGMILPNEDYVLWLDIDTIVDADISELWDIDMTGYFYAGALEPKKSNLFFRYINTGVLMYNLDLLRDWNKEHELLDFLNTYHFVFPGQDVINLLCQGRLKIIDSEYNASAWTTSCHRPKIIHFAAIKPEDYMQYWAYKKYEQKELMGGDGNG